MINSETVFEPTVSVLAEIPEELHEALTGFIEANPDWDHDRVFAGALSLFLMQNGSVKGEGSANYRRAARVYLDTLFKNAV